MSRAQAVRGSPALCLHRSGAAPDSLDRAKPVSPRNSPARGGPENSGGCKAPQAAGPQGVTGRGPQGVTGRGPQGVAGRSAARRRRRRCSAARRRRRRRKASQAGGRKASQAAVPQGVAGGGVRKAMQAAGAAGAGRCWRKYAANHAEFRRRQHL